MTLLFRPIGVMMMTTAAVLALVVVSVQPVAAQPRAAGPTEAELAAAQSIGAPTDAARFMASMQAQESEESPYARFTVPDRQARWREVLRGWRADEGLWFDGVTALAVAVDALNNDAPDISAVLGHLYRAGWSFAGARGADPGAFEEMNELSKEELVPYAASMALGDAALLEPACSPGGFPGAAERTRRILLIRAHTAVLAAWAAYDWILTDYMLEFRVQRAYMHLSAIQDPDAITLAYLEKCG